MNLSVDHFNPVVTYANLLHCLPGYRFGPRRNYEHQMIYVVKGKGSGRIQERTYEAKAGDLFYYGPAITHFFQADAQDPFVLCGLHFVLNGSLANVRETYPLACEFVGPDHCDGITNELIVSSARHTALFFPEHSHYPDQGPNDIFHKMIEHYELDGPGSALMTRALFIQLVVQLQHWAERSKNASHAPHPMVAFVKSQLKMCADLPYTRSWLREWTQFHEDYVARLFKMCYGLSPHDYHLGQKIERAKQMLAQTSANVTQIADHLHFGTIHYFSRVFKSTVGLSPLEFRKHKRMI